MASENFEFSFKSKNNTYPGDKPRVYFSCHPDDFDRCFEKICKDIFESHDCTVYYTEDMSVTIPEKK